MGKTQGVYFVPCLRQKNLKMREIQHVMTTKRANEETQVGDFILFYYFF